MAVDKQCISVNDHVLVEYITERNKKQHYAGNVSTVEGDKYSVNFMKRIQGSAASFCYPEKPDSDLVDHASILLKLGEPTMVGGSMRAANRFIFGVDITGYNLQ